MDNNTREKSFQHFARAMCSMYEAVYEVDIYQDKMYTWKDRENKGILHDHTLGYKAHVKRICEKFVLEDYRQTFLDWMDVKSVEADFEGDCRTRELKLPIDFFGQCSKWYHIQMQLIDRSRESLAVMLLVKDIDEKQREELHRQQNILEAMQLMKAVNSAYDMVISANLTKNSYYMIGYDRFLNHTAEDQGSFDELIAAGISTVPEEYKQIFAESFGRENLLKAYQEGKKSVYLDHQQYSDDGALHWVSTHVMFTENPYNDDIMQITLSRCIDKLREEEEKNKKLLQDALHLAEQANNAKTDFLSRMSHDIRTPMNAIVGMNAIAQANLHDRAKVRDCLSKIDISSRFLLSLINDILDLSRIESGKLSISREPFDFSNMIHGIVAIISSQAVEKEQRFTIDMSDDIEQVYLGDELRLRQIFMNLLSNAHKYTPRGGAFSLEIRKVHQTEKTTILRFSVRDNGIGIAPEFLEKIFDPFSQENRSDMRSGSGLGLAITQNLVHLMNGRISVQSTFQKGSCFTVELPLKRTKQELEREDLLDESMRVLVVEDIWNIRDQISVILDRMNLDHQVAETSETALQFLSYAIEKQIPYDVVMIDWKMPDRDCRETVQQMRKLAGDDLLIIVMSPYNWTGVETSVRKVGADLFLASPFSARKIRAALTSGSHRDRQKGKSFHGEKILIVEDNVLNQEIAVTMLEMKNLKVELAGNGQEGLEKFAASRPGEYAMILMDIQMPVMNGYDSTMEIRRLDREDARTVPIYAMTADAFTSDVAKALASGMNGHLAKPVDFEKLAAILHRELNRRK